jgi:hypothetical protein
MDEKLPLLLFPTANHVAPDSGKGFPSNTPHLPQHGRQVNRLTPQIASLQDNFHRYKASISGALAGFEPETVLVIEIAGSVDNFKQAVEAAGLEWIGEWDLDELKADQDFYIPPKIGIDFFKNKLPSIKKRDESREIRDLFAEQGIIDKHGILAVEFIPQLQLPEHLESLEQGIIQCINQAKNKPLSGRLFISLGNEQAMNEMLSLWDRWKEGIDLPYGKTKWQAVFNQLHLIRRWGIEETLRETGMIDRWRDYIDPMDETSEVHCQIELFYRKQTTKRQQNEQAITRLLNEIGGKILGPFIDMPDIAFHSVKASLPAGQVSHLLHLLEKQPDNIDIQLFNFSGIMYFRPTGQSLAFCDEGEGDTAAYPTGKPELPAIAAIIDGAPLLQHEALRDRINFDDPDNLSANYQPGERKHGTSMASLVIHGELIDGQDNSLPRMIHHVAVLQPNPHHPSREEHVPDEVFLEDRIERAVLRMLKGEGNTPAQAPDIKIINLSLGDWERPFIHTVSPLARLLDWLSWKYRVLFCVSAGNYTDNIDIGMAATSFTNLSDEDKVLQTLKAIQQGLSQRRLLSPAESLNSLTVGATHSDRSENHHMGNRTDIIPNASLVSPASRFGHGFRRSIKPEIQFPGGRQLYNTPVLDTGQIYSISGGLQKPGQKVAYDTSAEGNHAYCGHTRGTSNATALTTRAGSLIYEILSELKTDNPDQIPGQFDAVLIKALLVHGARHHEDADQAITSALKSSENSRRFKEVLTRYLGYGSVDIERVLQCTNQRATALGCSDIRDGEVHEYRFPLPPSLSEEHTWRRMVITLVWFTPINPNHRNIREAKLEFCSTNKWDTTPLKLRRIDSDVNQVKRGTVQHEILEGSKQIASYQDGESILLQVHCKKDATEALDDAIPYGIAVTLEVREGVDIPIYQEIRTRIRPQVPIPATP